MKRLLIQLLSSLLPFCGLAQALSLSPGVNIIMTGSPSLVLNDIPLVNNGRFSAGNSTVCFTGNHLSYIGGDNPVAFYNLALRMSSGDLQLRNNSSVGGHIMMDSGNLLLNTWTLDLGATGSISGERNESRITGSSGGNITTTALLNAPHAVNPGNIGVEISSEANLGQTRITRGHVQQSNAPGQTGIQRYFDIAPSLQSNAAATLRFYYLDAELAGYDKNRLSLFSGTPGQVSWTIRGKDNSDAVGNWILKSNTPALQRYTLALAATAVTSVSSAQVYPNPSRTTFTVSWYSATEKEGVISLLDQSGRLLESKSIHCMPGVNKTAWNIGRYAAGAYSLVFDRLEVNNTTIVKQ